MVGFELREIWEKNERNEQISALLECYKSAKNMAELPSCVSKISVSNQIKESTKKQIISLVINEYVNPVIFSNSIYSFAFLGSDYLFSLLFEKGFINKRGLYEYLKTNDNIKILNEINKNFNNGQKIERVLNYLFSLLNQNEKQNLFLRLLDHFEKDKNLLAISFLLKMHEVTIPKHIDKKNLYGSLAHINKSDVFGYLVDLLIRFDDEKDKKTCSDLIKLLCAHGMTTGTTLRYTDENSEWHFEDIRELIENEEYSDILDTSINNKNPGSEKIYYSVLYFYYYNLSSQINDFKSFRQFTIKDTLEYGIQNGLYILDIDLDNEKMIIKYSCDSSLSVEYVIQSMKTVLCSGTVYQILFPCVFTKGTNIWTSEAYTEEGSITFEKLNSFKRRQKQEKFPKK